MPPTVAVGQSRLPPCRNDYLSRFWDKCQGTLTLPDGEYVGEFKDGKSNGQGTFTDRDGEKYVGEFRDDEENGS